MSGRRPVPVHRRGPGSGPPGAMPAEKAKNFKGTVKRLLGYLEEFRLPLLGVFVMAMVGTAFNIFSPKVLAGAMNILFDGFMDMVGQGQVQIDFGALGRILAVLLAMYVLNALFTYFQHYLMSGVTQKTIYRIRREIDEKLTRLPLKYFDGNSKGDILSRMSNDADNVANTLQQSLVQIITSVVTIAGVLVMMLSLSLSMTLLCLLTLPLILVLTMSVVKRSQTQFSDMWTTTGDLNGHIEEMFTGAAVVKAFGREDAAVETFLEENEKLYRASWKAQFMSGIIMPLMGTVNNLGYVGICIMGAYRVIGGRMSFGDVTAFIQYQRQFSQPITQTSNMFNVLQSAVASAERIFELLDEAEEEETAEQYVRLSEVRGDVKFEHVKFGYSDDQVLIPDMNVEVKAGQMVAIVGPTGAGKTTLVNLLMRFYEIQGGRITIDGVDTRQMSREDLRSLFGMVLQDTWLFSGSIRDNIRYSNEQALDSEVVGAARAAHVHRFIKTLSHGYDTVLNEEGTNISQGQKQLLTIARAMLADPKILILDEATSSVDTRTEVLIQKAMNRLLEGRTSFVIAHRLSTIRDADLILVMKNGNIIEQGTHESLMKANGFYAELYNSQFAPKEAVQNPGE